MWRRPRTGRSPRIRGWCSQRRARVCSRADAASSASSFTIVGQNIAFDITTLEASSGQTIDITFDHRDANVPHNLHVTGPGGLDANTEIEAGPVVQQLRVELNAPGNYTYICDVHPTMMRGQIQVS